MSETQTPKEIMTKVAQQPAQLVLRVIDFLLRHAESHWAAQVLLHGEKMAEYGETSMGRSAREMHSDAFSQWHAIRQIQIALPREVTTFGGTVVAALPPLVEKVIDRDFRQQAA